MLKLVEKKAQHSSRPVALIKTGRKATRKQAHLLRKKTQIWRRLCNFSMINPAKRPIFGYFPHLPASPAKKRSRQVSSTQKFSSPKKANSTVNQRIFYNFSMINLTIRRHFLCFSRRTQKKEARKPLTSLPEFYLPESCVTPNEEQP